MGNRTVGMNITSKLKTKRTAQESASRFWFSGCWPLSLEAQFEPIRCKGGARH